MSKKLREDRKNLKLAQLHDIGREITGATNQQRYTKFKKPINQQNNEIFCYVIPKQQNEKPIFC